MHAPFLQREKQTLSYVLYTDGSQIIEAKGFANTNLPQDAAAKINNWFESCFSAQKFQKQT